MLLSEEAESIVVDSIIGTTTVKIVNTAIVNITFDF